MDKKQIIEIDAIFEYDEGKVRIQKLNTNKLSINLTTNLIKAINDAIVEHYSNLYDGNFR